MYVTLLWWRLALDVWKWFPGSCDSVGVFLQDHMQGEDHASVCTQRDHMQAEAVPWVINTVVGGECVFILGAGRFVISPSRMSQGCKK